MAKTNLKLAADNTELKLNLGCGDHKIEGFIGVDIRRLPEVDKLVDLKKTPWPWKDASVSEIVANYYLSYLTSHQRIIFFEECWRILKKGGKLVVKTPHWSCMRAISDPYFQWPPICETTFLVFNAEWRKANHCAHYPIKCDFDFGYAHVIDAELGSRNDEYKQFAIKNYTNNVLDIVVTMTKR